MPSCVLQPSESEARTSNLRGFFALLSAPAPIVLIGCVQRLQIAEFVFCAQIEASKNLARFRRVAGPVLVVAYD